MTAARLEELAAWCDRQKETLQAHEITDIADNYADLARCAWAWEKVERHKASVTHQSGRWHCALGWFTHTIEDTALEAVEAAEVTDANKG